MAMKFPDPNKGIDSYTFKNNYFRKKKLKKKVLEYNNNFEGWSEELTLLHENSNSRYHPMDILSRENLINHLKIKTKESVLEIGCSSGWLIDDLQKNLKKLTTLGQTWS